MNPKTRVVHINKDEYDVLIDRSTEFGNPYWKGTRSQNVRNFGTYFHQRLRTDPAFRKRVEALAGQTLGCWCKPKACHGDVIAEYLNSLNPLPAPLGIDPVSLD